MINNSRFYEIYKQHSKLNNNTSFDDTTLDEVIQDSDLSSQEIKNVLTHLENYNNVYTTQQMKNVDYSKFENHVFFDSAVDKVNYAFNTIKNIPYDYTKYKYNQYVRSLDGYTNYILEKIYPKYLGYAHFDRTNKIKVKNIKNSIGTFTNSNFNIDDIGFLYPTELFSFNFWIKFASQGFFENQVVFKFFNEDELSGYICYIDSDVGDYYLNFLMINNQQYNSTKCKISANIFQNININVQFNQNGRVVNYLVNGEKVDKETSSFNLSTLYFDRSLKNLSTSFILGHAENLQINLGGNNIVFQNFSGDIDEFKHYHDIQTRKRVKENLHKNVYGNDFNGSLRLYLRFNELAGEYNKSFVCIDYSGNKSHGYMMNSDDTFILNTQDFKINENTPLKLERLNLSPVLNNDITILEDTKNSLIQKASVYDENNDNIVFNLFPKHFFLQQSDTQLLPIFSNTDVAKSETDPFDKGLSNNNDFVNLVLIWARYFDQLKIYIDSITSIVDVEYQNINDKSILGIKIPMLCKMFGLNFTEIFPSITKSKLENESLLFEDVVNERSIRSIQNEIWFKILLNSQNILKSKGTKASINQIQSAVGISNLQNVAIKEYVSTYFQETENFFIKAKKSLIGLNFLTKETENKQTTNPQISGFSLNKFYLEIPNLKSSQNILKNSNFVDVNPSDIGLGTNFTIEMFFKNKKINNMPFEENINNDSSLANYQNNTVNSFVNLFRIDYVNSPVINAYFAKTNSQNDFYNFYVDIKPVINSYRYNITLNLSDIDIESHENYISISQKVEGNNLIYTVFVTKANTNDIEEKIYEVTKSINISQLNSINNLTSKSDNLNFRIGNFFYDNNTSQLFSLENTDFIGEIYCIRTWSKSLSKKEKENHYKNIFDISESEGSNSYLINNFIIANNNKLSDKVIDVDKTYYSIPNESISRRIVNEENVAFNNCFFGSYDLNLDIDNNLKYIETFINEKNLDISNLTKENRVNIVSYENQSFKEKTQNFNVYPIHDTPENFVFEEENTLSVDFSIVKTLNDDISKIILGLENFNEFINKHNMYSPVYFDLEKTKNEYFMRLSDTKNINYQSLANIFRYLDNIMSSLIKEMIPSKSNFIGFNLVYESHILERHKYHYKRSYDLFTGDNQVFRVNKYS